MLARSRTIVAFRPPGDWPPVERPIRAALGGGAQSLGLLLRPQEEIFVVKAFRLAHIAPRRVGYSSGNQSPNTCSCV